MQETWSLATNPDLGTALFLYSSHASPKTPTTTTFQSTVFEENRRKFDALNHQWDGLLQAGRRAEKAPKSVSKPLAGLRILDVGCGGGLLSEPLARLGATVTGIDPTPGCIEVARAHADGDLEIRDSVVYEAVEAEELVRRCVKFDAVVASEVVDHVQNYRDFVKCCVALTEDGGSLFFTTINRTLLSYLIVKIAAEYIFRIVPAGLHDWNMFVPPEELEEVLETNGCHVRLIHGSFFNPLTQTWSWLKSTDLTYALHAVKSPV
ncbi:ubiquinone biosynthesis O-methyltransferase, mitochondrial isoform X2 [Ixodes scapularis]|uniref:ubiquinone biosynthesis O-methyltransferase, mitochondrial isoform X2 n=1 Tax=Ixodes scapularis TaxID=6945 RepID=UPI001A9EF057|nr:ubiquinone biosynthesis O-methyltransferase, mitochondrial isoform X2 [Ixodes scapularis]